MILEGTAAYGCLLLAGGLWPPGGPFGPSLASDAWGGPLPITFISRSPALDMQMSVLSSVVCRLSVCLSSDSKTADIVDSVFHLGMENG